MTTYSQSGYTFIELLIVSTIIVIIMAVSFGGLATVLTNRSKADNRVRIKEQGDFVIQRIHRLITNALEVQNTTPGQCGLNMSQITIIDAYNQPLMIQCNNATNELMIGNEAVIDSAANYDLTNCSISCYNNNGDNQAFTVDVSFSLSDMTSSEVMSFSTKAALRN